MTQTTIISQQGEKGPMFIFSSNWINKLISIEKNIYTVADKSHCITENYNLNLGYNESSSKNLILDIIFSWN